MKKFLSAAAALSVLAPSLAFAQSSAINGTFNNLNSTANNLAGFIRGLTNTVNAVIPLLLAVSVVVFIWGVITYILRQGPKAKDDARHVIIWGIVGIAVSIAILGLANLLINFFGINTGSGGLHNTDIPMVPTT